jgi:lipopolysaccharide transport system ATP-binding protein
MKPIVRVQNLSKQYRIGARAAAYGTFREAIADMARAPLRLLQNRSREALKSTIWALKDVNLEVEPGEVVGIIGRNGAGKSTLLKVLTRITEPTRGRVELYGRVASLLEVGTGFHAELTGRENVYLNGAILGMKKEEIDRKFDEIVAFAEIEQFLDTPVKRYSSGMYMRLAFAVAAHLEPEILLVDEVLAVGDTSFQRKCLDKMREVSQHGRTILFVSHNLDAVRKLCSKAILLERGAIDVAGETDFVLKKYLEGEVERTSIYEVPPPTYDNPPGHAYKLIVEDSRGEPIVAIPVGKPWQIRVYLKVMRKIEHFIVAIGLRTEANVPLRTSWSKPETIEPGEYQALFREDVLWLCPGRYSITVGLSSSERPFHYAEDVGVIEIAEFSAGVDLLRVTNVGLILNPLKIELQKSPKRENSPAS